MNRLFQPVDIASLVFFRIAFGLLGFTDVLNTWVYYHLMKDAYTPAGFQFRYYGFEWVRPLPDPWMSILFLFICALAILVAVGKWYRISASLFALGFTYIFLLEKAFYLNHGYLFCWISALMPLLPANRAFSADVLRKPVLYRPAIPFWPLFLLRFLMGVVYVFGGIAKLNADWLHAVPLAQWLDAKGNIPLLGPLLEQGWMAWFMAYGGLLLDLSVVGFLLFRRTRPWAFAAVIFFHLMNLLVFSIGIFPYLSLALTALFFPPSFPRQAVGWLVARVRLVARLQEWWLRRIGTAEEKEPLWQEHLRWRPVITAGIAVFILFHFAVPWRHHFFPGDVAWTEEGHRYAWRMMLRSKHGYGHFTVLDLDSGQRETANPGLWLSRKQEHKLYTHPDMILQFAHFLRDKYREQGRHVAVYADIQVQLNFRKYSPLIDPMIDLAQEKWRFFRRSEWILPEKR
ncbi:MAG: HTTM domain-containing protein [Phaeodactylibacter sp.]|nr:HTTM domain-containing protein [Phaeodactylibacter sp.]